MIFDISIPFPSSQKIASFLDKIAQKPFAYAAINATRNTFPKGYDHDRNSVQIGIGKADFERAKKAIQNWQHFPSPWTKAIPENTSIKVGLNVAVLFRIFGIWWLNSARVVYVIDEASRYGFAYGTLPNHVEKGEEYFGVELRDDGTVWYEINAFSKPKLWFVWLAYPFARAQQRRFVRNSQETMQRISGL